MSNSQFALSPQTADLSHEGNDNTLDDMFAVVEQFGSAQHGKQALIVQIFNGMVTLIDQISGRRG